MAWKEGARTPWVTRAAGAAARTRCVTALLADGSLGAGAPASFRPGDAFTNGSRHRWVLAGYGGMCQKAAPGGPASWKWKGAWDDEPARRSDPARRRRRGSGPSCRDGLAVH